MKCTCGNPMRQILVALDDIWWSCLICGRTKPATGEENDMPSPRGWCAHCKQDDRPLISKSAIICHSCYKRQQDAKKAELNPAKPAVTETNPAEPVTVDEPEHSEPAQNIPENIQSKALQEALDKYGPEDDYTCEPPSSDWTNIDLRQARRNDMREHLRLNAGVIMHIPDDLAQEWRNRGLTGEHVLGLIELHLNGELHIRRYL